MDRAHAVAAPRVSPGVTLSVVELYPYVPYIQYLLLGSVPIAGDLAFLLIFAVLALAWATTLFKRTL